MMDAAAQSAQFEHWREQAEAARAQGDLTAGLGHARCALDHASQPEQRLQAQRLLCFFWLRSGQHATLLAEGEAWLPQFSGADQAEARLELMRYLVQSCLETGHAERAIRYAQSACELAREIGSPDGIVRALNGSAACLGRLGDFWQAALLLEEALALARCQSNATTLLATLNNTAGVAIETYHLLHDEVDEALAQRSLAHARATLEEALPLCNAAVEPLAAVFVMGNLGEVLTHQNELAQGEALLQQALTQALAHGQSAQVARIQCTLGENHRRQGLLALADARLSALWDGPERPQERSTLLVLHRLLARVKRDTGQWARAVWHLEQADLALRRRVAHQLQTQALLLVSRETAELAHQARRNAQAQADLWAQQANRDALTRLANRRLVDHVWPAFIEEARQSNAPLSVAVVDIDHFKQVNDRFGHRLGDAVLVALAQLLLRLTRDRDVAARIGGEEFLLLLPDTDLAGARLLCERLRKAVLAHDWQALAPGLVVTVSAGLAQSPPLDADTLFDLADRALYSAKLAGRNRVEAAPLSR
jgi:diguanylate cyclase (GGDEF)-like protein